MTELEQINEIMDNFDFEGVHMVMSRPLFPNYDCEGNIIRRDCWRMLLPGPRFTFPSEQDLKNLARELLLEIASRQDDDFYYIHQGPFIATNRYGNIGLTFSCEHWECEKD